MAKQRGGAEERQAVVLALLAVGVGLYWWLSKDNKPAPEPAINPLASARGACGLFIERLARNPDSVKPIEQSQWPAQKEADGLWTVRANFRAQNGFGGMNIERRTCVMRLTGDEWSLVTFR